MKLWYEVLLDTLIAEGHTVFPYVPDGTWKPFLNEAARRPEVTLVPLCREEEGVGILAGTYLAGKKGAMIMQSSGVGNSLNAIGSLMLAQRIPMLMFMTQRGALGETVSTQIPFGYALRRVLEPIGIQYYEADDVEKLPFLISGATKTAYVSRTAVAVMLTPFLTGGSKQ